MAKADRFEGLDADKVTDNTKLTAMSASFAESKHLDLDIYPAERAMLYKLQKMNDEIKELHRYLGAEVTSNTVTNLSTTVDGTSLTINSSDGTNASIPAATNTAWGALTDNNVRSLTSASAAPPAEGSYHNGLHEYLVWIPGTRFNGPNAVHGEGVVTVSDRTTYLYYEFAGIDRKKVTHAYVYTSATVARGLTIKRWRGTHGASYATLANGVATNTSQDITDWSSQAMETLSITVAPGSTSVALYGVTLTLTRA